MSHERLTFESLQAWMEHYKVNTTELARRCRMSKSHLSMVLSGGRRLSIYKAITVFEVVGREVPIERMVEWPPIVLQVMWREVAMWGLIILGGVT